MYFCNSLFNIFLPDPSLRHHEFGLCRSVLLDPRDPGLESRHPDGARHLAHRHVRPDHAAARRSQDHRGRRHAQGSSPLQRSSET